MKIVVLGGGSSPERSISLQSSRAVYDALTDLGHETTYLDPVDGEHEIIEAARKADVVFPILHGAGGEDGEIQAILERAGKPYLGSGVEASQVCFDKVVFKEFLLARGLPTANFAIVSRETFDQSGVSQHPFVLKPILGGSSIDLVIEREPKGMTKKIEEVFGRHHNLLCEELAEGIEITAPVLGEEALPVIEIVPPAGENFDYENKYNGETAEIVPAKHIDAAKQKEIQKLALQIHHEVGARHLSRTDMIIMKDGRICVLEMNTSPGMTAQSLFPKAAAAGGYSFSKLVAKFVDLAKSN
jgi:D-alanine-D-alanine ligase